MQRFNYNADTVQEALNYIKNRALQLLKFDAFLTHHVVDEKYVVGFFEYNEAPYISIYVLESWRGKGLFEEIQRFYNHPIITAKECAIEGFLKYKMIDYVALHIEDCDEYKMIQDYYGDKVTERSGVYHMNHIDEGIAVLKWINASEAAIEAYILHPIFQGDGDLLNNHARFINDISPRVLMNVMEYRSVANEYLSHRSISSLEEIRLSPLEDVNQMLIADKIQNRKDFYLYHQGTHQRSDALCEYFDNWLKRLGVSEERLAYLTDRLK